MDVLRLVSTVPQRGRRAERVDETTMR
jgi:hypothetical protein